MRPLDYRRHQDRRAKLRAHRMFAIWGDPDPSPAMIGIHAQARKFCSCGMCSQNKRHQAGPSISEQRRTSLNIGGSELGWPAVLWKDRIQIEHTAYLAARSGLMEDHEGEYVIFKDGQEAGFFPDFQAAYEEGLERYGLDEIFLVDQVCAPRGPTGSISWDLGVF